MSKKAKSDGRGIVWSTDPNYRFEELGGAIDTLPPAQQKLRVRLETKGRGGKAATLIAGFAGREADLEALGRRLKSLCGTGGAAKDGEILIQGDHRQKVIDWLKKEGYRDTK